MADEGRGEVRGERGEEGKGVKGPLTHLYKGNKASGVLIHCRATTSTRQELARKLQVKLFTDL